MSTIITIQASDVIANSRADINTNFSNLNTDKQEKGAGVTGNIVQFGASNVLGDSGKVVPAGTIVGTSDNQTLTNKTLTSPVITNKSSTGTDSGVETLTNKTIAAGSNTISGITEAMQTLADNTTNNVSSTKHGYVPKSPGDATQVLLGGTTPAFGAVPGVSFVAGVVADLVTTGTANNDVTVTTTFTPRFIKLHYFLQGWSGAGVTGYTGRKGIAVYNGTTLQFDFPILIAPDETTKLSGDDGTFPATTVALVNKTNETAAPASGPNVTITLSIASISSTTCVIRRATTGDATHNARCKIAYEIYA